MLQRFWFWKDEKEWLDFVEKTNKEFFRCLKPNGLLYYKMTESKGCTDQKDLIKRLTNFELIKDIVEKSQSNFSKYSKNSTSKAHFMTFRPLTNKA